MSLLNSYHRAADCAESLDRPADLAEIYIALGHACYNSACHARPGLVAIRWWP
jgi:hypothetical protein